MDILDDDLHVFDSDELQLTSEEDIDTNSDTDINSNFFDDVTHSTNTDNNIDFNDNNNNYNDNEYEKIVNTGRWTQKEHELFMEGIRLHHKNWRPIAELIKTRSVVQIRTHAQKYFQKLHKAKGNSVDMNTINNNSVTTTKITKKESKRKLSGLIDDNNKNNNNNINISMNNQTSLLIDDDNNNYIYLKEKSKMNRNNDYNSNDNLLSLSPSNCPEQPKENGEESPSPKGVAELLETVENNQEEQKKWAEMNTFSWKIPDHEGIQSDLIDIMKTGKGGFMNNSELFHTEQSDFSTVCDAFFAQDDLLLLLDENEQEIDIAEIAEGL